MVRKCLIEGCKDYGDILEAADIVEHYWEFHKTSTLLLEGQEGLFALQYDREFCGKGPFVQVPFIIEYHEAHFLFVVVRSNRRHYFWLYSVQNGISSGGHQIHADLDLLPVKKWAAVIKSNAKTTIFPIATTVDEILKKKSTLFYISDTGLKMQYLAISNIYQFRLSFKELQEQKQMEPPANIKLEVIEVEIVAKSEGEEGNTRNESCNDKCPFDFLKLFNISDYKMPASEHWSMVVSVDSVKNVGAEEGALQEDGLKTLDKPLSSLEKVQYWLTKTPDCSDSIKQMEDFPVPDIFQEIQAGMEQN